jgi:hypothetical protein
MLCRYGYIASYSWYWYAMVVLNQDEIESNVSQIFILKPPNSYYRALYFQLILPQYNAVTLQVA